MPLPDADEAADDDGEGNDGDEPLDLLLVLNAMAMHFHEKRMDIVAGWSWKLFVREWAIFIDDAGEEREREEKREQEREEREQEQMLRQELDRAYGNALSQ